jgi:hypothetical protein
MRGGGIFTLFPDIDEQPHRRQRPRRLLRMLTRSREVEGEKPEELLPLITSFMLRVSMTWPRRALASSIAVALRGVPVVLRRVARGRAQGTVIAALVASPQPFAPRSKWTRKRTPCALTGTVSVARPSAPSFDWRMGIHQYRSWM